MDTAEEQREGTEWRIKTMDVGALGVAHDYDCEARDKRIRERTGDAIQAMQDLLEALAETLQTYFDECRNVECVPRRGSKVRCYDNCPRIRLRELLRSLREDGMEAE